MTAWIARWIFAALPQIFLEPACLPILARLPAVKPMPTAMTGLPARLTTAFPFLYRASLRVQVVLTITSAMMAIFAPQTVAKSRDVFTPRLYAMMAMPVR